MERRNFIQKSAIGLIGFNVIGTGNVPSHLFQSSVVRDWVHKVVAATGASKRSGLFLPSGLSEAVALVTKTLSDKGFKGHRSSFYFYGDQERYCFFAIEMYHEASAMTDIVLPVLHKEENGQWKQFTTINGYQLESLAYAADSLDHSQMTLQHLLLPVASSSHRFDNQGFTTSRGGVKMITNTYSYQAPVTSISIFDGPAELFTGSFISGHCLTSSTLDV